MTDIYNRSDRKEIRRRLRRDVPQSESRLWSKLRGRQIGGAKFRRQFGVGPYVVDFYCPDVRLAIEVDGDSHFSPEAKGSDAIRQVYIESFGIRVLRFTNADIAENTDGVMERIASEIDGDCRTDGGRPSVTSEPPCVPPLQGGKGRVDVSAGGMSTPDLPGDLAPRPPSL